MELPIKNYVQKSKLKDIITLKIEKKKLNTSKERRTKYCKELEVPKYQYKMFVLILKLKDIITVHVPVLKFFFRGVNNHNSASADELNLPNKITQKRNIIELTRHRPIIKS